ncbi:hypothetical protein N9V13_05555 [Betaproteobacteria bacterium]|nr:hypothetical protein [Betaproteobacteria bacterium]
MKIKAPIGIKHKSLWTELRRAFLRNREYLNTSETWFINIYNGIGDAFIVLGLLKSFREYHNAKYIVVVLRKGLLPIANLFKTSYDDALVLDKDYPREPKERYDFYPNELILSSKPFVHQADWRDLVQSNNIPHLDWYKYGLRLPMKMPFQNPQFNTNIEAVKINELKLKKNKSVILFPYTNFGTRIRDETWIQIIKILHSRDFTVYTNCKNSSFDKEAEEKFNNNSVSGDNHRPLPETIPLDVELDNLWGILEYCNFGIFAGGGLSLVSAYTKANILVIQPNKIIEGEKLNSRFAQKTFTALQVCGSIKVAAPDRSNLTEILDDDLLIAKLEQFLKNGNGD